MTPQFILLPSGLRINTAHILEYREDHPGKTIIRENCKGFDSVASFVEDMTAAELDSLLMPNQSAIISPVIDLDRLKPGAGCQFTYEGAVKHGVIDYVTGSGIFDISSDGVRYQFDPVESDLYRYDA